MWFNKKQDLRIYLFFETACGCSKMIPAGPMWKATPEIVLPLQKTLAVVDYVNNEYGNPLVSDTKRRIFRLMRQEPLDDGKTVIFTYSEVVD